MMKGLNMSSPPTKHPVSPTSLHHKSPMMNPGMLVLLVFTLGLPQVNATSSDGSKSSVAPWIPAVVVVLALVFVAAVVVIYRNYQKPGPIPGSTAPIHEVTAMQLAGMDSTMQNTGSTPAARTTSRRPRRTRRTPSQISTKSLPAYNKEAGDQELVIYRGPEGEDSDDSHSGLMEAVPEDENDGQRTSDDISQLNTSQTPLLSETPAAPGLPPVLDNLPPLFEHRPSSDLSHMRDVRGPTPAYDDVVLNDDLEAQVPASDAQATINANPRRNNSIRAFFSSLGGQTNTQPVASLTPGDPSVAPGSHLSHTRGNSTHTLASVASSGENRSPSRSAIRDGQGRGHRPSQSGSSILNNFRKSVHRMGSSASLANSQPNLTSPSLLSLTSISAPLSHTLTRTEIVYPSGGPTPDQIRLISSRETLGRFGVPYGPDAVAYAAASRQSLHVGSPPEFDSLDIPARENVESRASGHARTDSSGYSTEESGQVLATAEPVASPNFEESRLASSPIAAAPSSSVPNDIPADSTPAPPSAFKSVSSPIDTPSRRTSDVSSIAYSFATAREEPQSALDGHFDEHGLSVQLELPTPTPSPPGVRLVSLPKQDGGGDHSPPTPTTRMSGYGHVAEATDATIRPSPIPYPR